jgi:YtkA-like
MISELTTRRKDPMKKLSAVSMMLSLILAFTGCDAKKVDTENLKEVTTHVVGDVVIVLLNSAGELKQGQNEFVVQFRNQKGQPINVGDVQLGSSMSMPSMAPMSGDSEITPTGQTGTYRVKSNFAMSGAWHFTVSWNGPHGQGSTAFNSNVR